ncbi:unnamed protein product [Rotaria sordida]|uniref:Uncharacterized protein n=1 Tax=Rotaria sordida TaxID=392033 RepID=A0A815L3L6_9BILA|nr:unnamed protein product [Rotaria sordida]CAF1158897.1 unnamed protein product [Rotaria sordida]CAF1400397.1 unnamed protein product [Rotaria sordida]CAF1404576.1 unnamed protein product [Rotaria sordida]
MFTREEHVDLLLNTLNEAVIMLLDACNANQAQDEILSLKKIAKNKNSNHKQQQKTIKKCSFYHKKPVDKTK